ncbi:MAG: hypothetical protein M1830_001300 [Pleopsidium flavum]|nr:MAG: hypothetical protein M1830_001300 [Pleopsidium flavum]
MVLLEKTLYSVGVLTICYLLARGSQFLFTYLRPSSLPRYLHGDDAWALVTGSSDGIGLGFAQELCHRSFNVILHGRNPQKLEKVKADLNREFPSSQIRLVIADASSSSTSLDDLVSSIQDVHLTVLVNNVGGIAGILSSSFKAFETHTREEVDGLLNVNERFATQLTRALIPILARNGPSLIMNIGSNAGMGMPYISVYSATKAYILSWSQALTAELKAEGQGITVLGIGVGSVQSAQNKSAASLTCPTSRTMASAALNRVGCGQAIVSAYLPHALQKGFMDLLPEGVLQNILINMLKPLKDKKEKAF